MGLDGQFARQQWRAGHVGFESKTEVAAFPEHVRCSRTRTLLDAVGVSQTCQAPSLHGARQFQTLYAVALARGMLNDPHAAAQLAASNRRAAAILALATSHGENAAWGQPYPARVEDFTASCQRF
jgi:hypothetical protein